MATEKGLTYLGAGPAHTLGYLQGPLLDALGSVAGQSLLDVGCGNGAVTAMLADRGARVVGLDLSETGIAIARQRRPDLEWRAASVYADLSSELGRTFPIVLSLEVIEHLFDPRLFARRVFEALDPGGLLVLSTPYHGYFKNVVLALTGRMDAHFTALWDGGHIKFFSWATVRALLEEAGFVDIRFRGAGRLPLLWKSMLVSARRPA